MADLGGRAMWVDGGDDIDMTEVQWAIAAALEQLPIAELVAITDTRQRAANWAVLAAIEAALEQVGLTTRQTSALLRRPRTALGGRSAQQLFDKLSMTADEAGQVVDLAVRQVRSLAGSAGVTSFMQMLSGDLAVSRAFVVSNLCAVRRTNTDLSAGRKGPQSSRISRAAHMPA